MRANIITSNGRKLKYAPDHPYSTKVGYIYNSRYVAEKLFQKYLPTGAVVHHTDGNKANDDPSNLVICENNQYHLFLEMRIRAYRASGHPEWRKCKHCKKYDDLKNLILDGTSQYHRICRNKYLNERYHKKKAIAHAL